MTTNRQGAHAIAVQSPAATSCAATSCALTRQPAHRGGIAHPLPALLTPLIATLLALAPAGCADEGRAATPQTRVVTIEGFTYEPASITVAAGDTIVWRNQDIVPHTATAGDGFDTGSIAPDQQGSWVATRAGKFDYECTFHPTMKGTVVVQ